MTVFVMTASVQKPKLLHSWNTHQGHFEVFTDSLGKLSARVQSTAEKMAWIPNKDIHVENIDCGINPTTGVPFYVTILYHGSIEPKISTESGKTPQLYFDYPIWSY